MIFEIILLRSISVCIGDLVKTLNCYCIHVYLQCFWLCDADASPFYKWGQLITNRKIVFVMFWIEQFSSLPTRDVGAAQKGGDMESGIR